MSAMRLIFLLISLQYSVMAFSDESSHEIPSYVSDSNKIILVAWLKRHPEYRVASEEDCNCTSDIDEKRTYGKNANPNYHPYYVSGDFNNDRLVDLAVVFIKSNDKEKATFAVFNAPLTTKSEPAYILEDQNGGFFYGAEANLPAGSLCVGRFGSECGTLVPDGSGYKVVWGED